MTEILDKPTIFACIPALNEELSIGFILSQTKKFVSEIFVCDDGSTDNTASQAATLGAYVISHPKNLGKGAALKTLFNAVEPLNPDVVVIIDGDGQHNPNEIPKLVEPVLQGEADFVIGSRFLDIKSVNLPLYRRFGIRVLNWLSASGSALQGCGLWFSVCIVVFCPGRMLISPVTWGLRSRRGGRRLHGPFRLGRFCR